MIINSARISKKSLFRLLLIGNLFGWMVFFLIAAIGSLFGLEAITISLNGASVTGVPGFILVLITWPVFSLFWATFTWIFSALGLWIYSTRKSLTLELQEGELVSASSA